MFNFILLFCLFLASNASAESVTHLKKLTESERQLSNSAANILGFQYFSGDGVDQNDKEAAKYFRLAAEQGDVNAQAMLAYIKYHGGEGVAQDYKEAIKWWRLAAEQGDAVAQHALGLSYLLGKGVENDSIESVKWIRLAAEQGYGRAQFMMGISFREGISVVQDYKTAHMWFNIAAANGAPPAADSREAIAKKMSPEDVIKAQDMASEWIRTH